MPGGAAAKRRSEGFMQHKKLGAVSCVMVVSLALALGAATLVSAGDIQQVRLLLNGQEILKPGESYIVDDKTVAPVRAIAEALGAKVDWDESTQTVRIIKKDGASLERRMPLLEKALMPGTAKETVETWARGIETRNGALQFVTLSPMLRAAYEPGFESSGWVTGTSSPWVVKYTISDLKEIRDSQKTQTGNLTETPSPAYETEVAFDMGSSTGSAGTYVFKVRVQKVADTGIGWDERWAITDIDRVSTSGTPKNVSLPGFSLSVELPADWQVKLGTDDEVSIVDEKGAVVGGAWRLGGLFTPNHSSTVWSREIETPTGKWAVYSLERSEPAASGNPARWSEAHAFLERGAQDYLDLWFKSDLNHSWTIERAMLEAILGSAAVKDTGEP
jgi:hypothetical protein